jgi:hypothetical protein
MSEDFTSETGEQNAPELHEEQAAPEYHENPELHEEQPNPEYREIPNAGFNPQKIVVPTKRRDPVFYIALALAAFCILGSFGATAFITGFMAGRSMGQNNGFRGYETQRMFIVRDRSSFMREGGHHRGQIGFQRGQISAKVAIIQDSNGLQFSQPVVKIPAGGGIIWINQTDQVQMLLIEQRPALNLMPNQATVLFLGEGDQSSTFSLASDPNVTITVYVGY